jgi:hypothetical protein
LEKVLNEFLEFDPKMREQIKVYLRSSTLVFNDLFVDLPEIRKSDSRKPDIQKKQVPTQAFKSDSSDYPIFQGNWPDKTIITLPLNFSKHEELLGFLAKIWILGWSVLPMKDI